MQHSCNSGGVVGRGWHDSDCSKPELLVALDGMVRHWPSLQIKAPSSPGDVPGGSQRGKAQGLQAGWGGVGLGWAGLGWAGLGWAAGGVGTNCSSSIPVTGQARVTSGVKQSPLHLHKARVLAHPFFVH